MPITIVCARDAFESWIWAIRLKWGSLEQAAESEKEGVSSQQLTPLDWILGFDGTHKDSKHNLTGHIKPNAGAWYQNA